MEFIELQDEKVPALGLGTWKLKGNDCKRAVKNALELGYRHIDTAQAYDNEEHVGQAINNSEVSRSDIWLTTKVWRTNFSHDKLKKSVNKSLEKLQTHYVDLLLIHWPPTDNATLAELIEAMQELVEQDKVRNIGISNFTPEQMEKAQDLAEIPILTNQVEYHPSLNQENVLEKAREMDVMLTAYSPLARGEVMGNETIKQVADNHGKSEAQVALRWLIQQENVAAIPKATSREHIKDNFDIFDFELSKEEMEKINDLRKKNNRKVNPSFAPDTWN
jgi:2,5-diketo-D-gluconate reductase B